MSRLRQVHWTSEAQVKQPMWLIAFMVLWLLAPVTLKAGTNCMGSDTKGLASIRSDGRTYLAVWSQTDQENRLDIYDSLACTNRISQFSDNGVWWQSMSAIPDGALLGFLIRSTAGEGWFGSTKLFLYDGHTFIKAFESGEEAELIDLNGDGYREVVEYLDGRGTPTGRVRINAWGPKGFRPVLTVKAADIFSTTVFRQLQGSGKVP